MSLSEPPPRISVAPPPPNQRHHHHPYPPPPRSETRPPGEPHTTLPPMSSLLSMHDRAMPAPIPMPVPVQAQKSSPYHPQPLPLQDSQHPLWLSEMEPTEPVRHIYHPAQPPPTSHNAYHRAGPYLVSTPSPQDLEAPPPHGKAPVVQQRQIRKILQRRSGSPKSHALEGSSSSSLPPLKSHKTYSAPPARPAPSRSQPRKSKQPPLDDKKPALAPSQTQPSKSMQISGLLSDDARSAGPPSQVSDAPANLFSAPSPPAPPRFSIGMRQQPIAARACGFGERDRRVIDPPPILQMAVEDPTASPEQMRTLLRQPCAVVHCTLWDPVANKDDTAMPGTTDKRQQRRLMGTLVSSPFIGKDEFNVEGCFFTFPDLSVRTPGTYSLRFSLMIIDPLRMRLGNSVPVSWVAFSDPFNVYNAKDFGGMRASTELTKKLKQQGCLISVKKGNARSNSRDDDDDDDDDDGDDEGGEQYAKRPAKRVKR